MIVNLYYHQYLLSILRSSMLICFKFDANNKCLNEVLISISAFSGYFAYIFPTTSINRKLWKTRTITDNIILFLTQSLVPVTTSARLAKSLLFLTLLPTLPLHPHILRSILLLFRRSSLPITARRVTFLAAGLTTLIIACGLTWFETSMELLVVSIFLIKLFLIWYLLLRLMLM